MIEKNITAIKWSRRKWEKKKKRKWDWKQATCAAAAPYDNNFIKSEWVKSVSIRYTVRWTTSKMEISQTQMS